MICCLSHKKSRLPVRIHCPAISLPKECTVELVLLTVKLTAMSMHLLEQQARHWYCQ